MTQAAPPRPQSVIAISSNKGGVGKTTLATNLAIYLRAVHEDLPVLVVPLDDQTTVDRMFSLGREGGPDANLERGFAERDLREVIQLGQYGVHYVPSPPDTAPLKERASDSEMLDRILGRTGWDGVVILDTKSDLEALTRNAYAASDRIIVPVSDWTSLEEAGKTIEMIRTARDGHAEVRLVFTLVDRRSKVGGDTPLYRRLADEAHARGWPYYKTHLTRSPRVESLNSGTDRPQSILHHARGTAVHSQMRELTLEVLHDLAPGSLGASAAPPASRPEAAAQAETPAGAPGAATKFGSARRPGTSSLWGDKT